MFPRSARFHENNNDLPGPGNYDPRDSRRASGVTSFAADGVQRFHIDKEEEMKLGPGYYATPAKPDRVPTRNRRSSISTLTDVRKKLDEGPSGAWKAERKIYEDTISELTEKVRESEMALKTQSARAQEAQAKVEAIQGQYDEEVTQRKELQEALAKLNLQHENNATSLKQQYEHELAQRSEVIARLETQLHESQIVKSECDQQVVVLSTQLSTLEDTRSALTVQVASLEANVQKQAEEYRQLNSQVQQHQEISASQQAELVTLRSQIDELEKVRSQLAAEHQITLSQAQGLEASLQQHINQCAKLEDQVRQGEESLASHRTEIQTLQQDLTASTQAQSQLSETLKEKQSICMQTEAKLEEVSNQLQEQMRHYSNLQSECEKQREELTQMHAMNTEKANELSQTMQLAEQQKAGLLETQDKLAQTERDAQAQLNKVSSELQAETQRACELQAELEEKTSAYDSIETTYRSTHSELQEKQLTICNLEAKLNSLQLMLTTSQNAFKEAQEQLNESNEFGSNLEATLAEKEEKWNKYEAECKACIEKLVNQVKKRNETILGMKSSIDKLTQEQKQLQQQKTVADKQILELQENLVLTREQVTTCQTQIQQAESNHQATQTELSQRISLLVNNLTTAESKIIGLETDVSALNTQLVTTSDETREIQCRLAAQVDDLRAQLSMCMGKCETYQQLVEEKNAELVRSEALLTREKTERAEADTAHTEEMLELQTLLHESQEAREGLLADLGSSEVQMQDLLARIEQAKVDAANHAMSLSEYEMKLSEALAKNECLVVQVANAEMEVENKKSDLTSSNELVADLRARLLKEQMLASEFESKFKAEVTSNGELTKSISENEERMQRQKEEIARLMSDAEQEKSNAVMAQHEHALKESHYKDELKLAADDLKSKCTDSEQLKQSLDMAVYNLKVATRKASEQGEQIEALQGSAKKLAAELTEQNTRYEAMSAEKDQRYHTLESTLRSHASKIEVLLEENASLKRAQSIDKLANERAVNTAIANMNIAHEELASTTTLCETRGQQLEKLDQSLALAVGDVKDLQQQLKTATESKTSTLKTYTVLLKAHETLEIKMEETEAMLKGTQAEFKSQEEAFAKYKESTANLVQENMDLSQQVEDNREAIETVDALRARNAELESTNRELQERLAVLDDEATESSNQAALLVGHNNQRQKINIHAKVTAENRKLRLENVRLSNALHDLRLATASSAVVDENVAPTSQRVNTNATPATDRSKNSRKLEETETPAKTGPLQEGFKSWQQKRQKSATTEKRTPLAQLTLATPQKKVGLI